MCLRACMCVHVSVCEKGCTVYANVLVCVFVCVLLYVNARVHARVVYVCVRERMCMGTVCERKSFLLSMFFIFVQYMSSLCVFPCVRVCACVCVCVCV